MKINTLFNKIKKFYYSKILKKRYFRTGSCKRCGACCSNIYVRHKNSLIKNESEFEKIKTTDDYSFYKHVEVIGKDDFGLIFACKLYDKENKLCTNHKNRPSICRNYPSEEIFSFGASLQDGCGYSFSPIESFEEVYSKILKRPPKEFKEYVEENNS